MKQQNNTDLGNKPIIVIIGLIASLISIFVFLTGNEDISAVFDKINAIASDLPYPSPTTVQASRPTDTPTDTPTDPTDILTDIPTNVPHLPNISSELLSISNEIPKNLYLAESDSDSTNEEVAEQYDNPTEMFNQLEERGRITGYYQNYLHEKGCNASTGFRQVAANIVIYRDNIGATQALDWYISQGLLGISHSQPETINDIGEKAFIIWSIYKDDCTPSNDLEFVTIVFQRYNAVGSVDLGSVAKTTEKVDMHALAIRIAQLIDLRIVAASK